MITANTVMIENGLMF